MKKRKRNFLIFQIHRRILLFGHIADACSLHVRGQQPLEAFVGSLFRHSGQQPAAGLGIVEQILQRQLHQPVHLHARLGVFPVAVGPGGMKPIPASSSASGWKGTAWA